MRGPIYPRRTHPAFELPPPETPLGSSARGSVGARAAQAEPKLEGPWQRESRGHGSFNAAGGSFLSHAYLESAFDSGNGSGSYDGQHDVS